MACGVCWRANSWISRAALGRPPGLATWPGLNEVLDLATRFLPNSVGCATLPELAEAGAGCKHFEACASSL